jgi:hypothetical protein
MFASLRIRESPVYMLLPHSLVECIIVWKQEKADSRKVNGDIAWCASMLPDRLERMPRCTNSGAMLLTSNMQAVVQTTWWRGIPMLPDRLESIPRCTNYVVFCTSKMQVAVHSVTRIRVYRPYHFINSSRDLDFSSPCTILPGHSVDDKACGGVEVEVIVRRGSCPACQEITRRSWNRKACYCAHNSLPLDKVLCTVSSIHFKTLPLLCDMTWSDEITKRWHNGYWRRMLLSLVGWARHVSGNWRRSERVTNDVRIEIRRVIEWALCF